jgi:hypothetical protein
MTETHKAFGVVRSIRDLNLIAARKECVEKRANLIRLGWAPTTADQDLALIDALENVLRVVFSASDTERGETT